MRYMKTKIALLLSELISITLKNRNIFLKINNIPKNRNKNRLSPKIEISLYNYISLKNVYLAERRK